MQHLMSASTRISGEQNFKYNIISAVVVVCVDKNKKQENGF